MIDFIKENESLCAEALSNNSKSIYSLCAKFRQEFGFYDRADAFILNKIVYVCQKHGFKPKAQVSKKTVSKKDA